jgi:hypothetical protein
MVKHLREKEKERIKEEQITILKPEISILVPNGYEIKSIDVKIADNDSTFTINNPKIEYRPVKIINDEEEKN